jgi:hypothetical protein
MLEQFRDVMIIIMAFTAIGTTVLFAALGIIIFRRISGTVKSVSDIVSDMRDVSSLVSNTVLKPGIRSVSFVTGARKALSTLAKRSRKKEGRSGK